MTIRGFGRITPLQGNVLCLAGLVLTQGGERRVPDEVRLRSMRAALGRLRRQTSADFGYCLARWHAFLQAREPFRQEYQHPYGWRTTSRRVEALIEDPERLRLVALLESEDPRTG